MSRCPSNSRTLDLSWQKAYELAWQAWQAGTIPVGAVVTSGDGSVIAAGRNRIFDESEPPHGQLAGCWIAHAEVNALAQLPPLLHEGYAITTTTEPCLLCAGAIMVTLRGKVTVRYAAPDPIAGGMEVALRSPQGLRRSLNVERLNHKRFCRFAEILTLEESLRRVPRGVVGNYYREHHPLMVEAAMRLTPLLAEATGLPLRQVLPAVDTAIAPIR